MNKIPAISSKEVMGRPPRIEFEGAFYHVFSRGNRREIIYRDSKDYMVFERMLLEAAEGSGLVLYKWNLLPNHFHLVVQTPDANLSEFMHRLLTRYACYFNRRYGLVGHVFQGRYKAILCDKEAYFLELIRYVALNPHRSKRLQEQAFLWPWSSHRYYMSGRPPRALARGMKEVLARFSDDPAAARRAYAAFLADGLKNGRWQDFYKVKHNRFVGDGAFVERIKRLNAEPSRREERSALPTDIDVLAAAVCHTAGMSLEQLRAPGRAQTPAAWRKVLIWIAQSMARIPRRKLALYLRRDPSMISHMRRQASQDRTVQNRVRRVLEHIKASTLTHQTGGEPGLVSNYSLFTPGTQDGPTTL